MGLRALGVNIYVNYKINQGYYHYPCPASTPTPDPSALSLPTHPPKGTRELTNRALGKGKWGCPWAWSTLAIIPVPLHSLRRMYWGGGKGVEGYPLPSHCFLHPSIPDYTLSPFLASRAPGCAKKGIGKMIGVKGVVLLLWAKGGGKQVW